MSHLCSSRRSLLQLCYYLSQWLRQDYDFMLVLHLEMYVAWGETYKDWNIP